MKQMEQKIKEQREQINEYLGLKREMGNMNKRLKQGE